MIPAPFALHRPTSIAEACDALAHHGPSASVLAGGQSLIVDLKQRRKTPRLLIDLSTVGGLDTITVEPDAVTIGAMARQSTVTQTAALVARLPLLLDVANAAADPMVRRRGTLVGACCQVAPGGDWVAAALALDASVLLQSVAGSREVPLTEFVVGAERTSLRPGEIARALRIPTPQPRDVMVYRKVKHASVGWSVASAAIILSPGNGRAPSRARIAVSGAVSHPQRLPALESALVGMDLALTDELDDAIDAALATLEYRGDYFASPDYRRRRLTVLLRRAVTEVGSR
jgi:CO/xanthine dehydrogenase FAD-binding subunit